MHNYMMRCGKKMIAGEILKADHFFSRFKGLMFKKNMDEQQGLWIEPCNQVHTFNMRFAIDVIFIDKNNKILYIEYSMKPRKVSKVVRHAHSVVELCAGRAEECGIETGDTLSFDIKQ